VRNNVRQIFGIPGVHTYSLIDALQERQKELAYIGTRHEQGAAYMAYGYAKSSGRVGAYTCVPGPGVLNTTGALCTAYAANAPVLCLTSEVFSHEIGKGHGILHELPDQLAILRGLTKWSERISHPTDAPRVVARAFEELLSGRPRPVALECPWDTLGQRALVELDVSPRPIPPPDPDPDAIEQAARVIAGATNPMIMVGSGALDAGVEVLELAKLLQAPVTAHRSGRGIGIGFQPEGDRTVARLDCLLPYFNVEHPHHGAVCRLFTGGGAPPVGPTEDVDRHASRPGRCDRFPGHRCMARLEQHLSDRFFE